MTNRSAPQVRGSEEELLRSTLRMNARLTGLLFGLFLGVGIFLATNWLVLKGGPIDADGQAIVGPHLALIGQYFLGYSVTFVGSLIGLCYGFAFGFVTGSLVGWLYNKFVDIFE